MQKTVLPERAPDWTFTPPRITRRSLSVSTEYGDGGGALTPCPHCLRTFSPDVVRSLCLALPST